MNPLLQLGISFRPGCKTGHDPFSSWGGPAITPSRDDVESGVEANPCADAIPSAPIRSNWREWFDLPEPPPLPPRYNVAPSQIVAVVGRKPDSAKRGLVLMSWGFVPRWAKDPRTGPQPINAQAETVASKAPFRDSFRDRRCLIPTDGFFEWETRDGTKRPHYFRPTFAPVAFAGIWIIWKGRMPRHCSLVLS